MFTSRLGAVFVTVLTKLTSALQLGLQAVVLEREGGGSGDRLEQVGLGFEPHVVHDRCDPLSVPLDQLDRVLSRRRRAPGRCCPCGSTQRPSETVPRDRASTRRRARGHPLLLRARRGAARPPRVRRRAPTPTSARAGCAGSRTGTRLERRRSTRERRERTPQRFRSTRPRSGDRRRSARREPRRPR